ncbi:protein indeterminate-domain 7-like [Asparagus officinalis]|uniref:protein indeterminate-domain 7-like n=1 Tax=Asparagus officinalis TaxID=4686 RepID=UPI00098E3FB4|nr:protein indeterminate-domain 7-like [Asparagus officinalis]
MATNRFLCEVCGEGFQREQNLQLHRRGHNLPWKLKQRNPRDAGRRKVYLCPEPTCVHHDPSRAHRRPDGDQKHFSRKHGEKKWKCDKCSKKYAVQSDWKPRQDLRHPRSTHCTAATALLQVTSTTAPAVTSNEQQQQRSSQQPNSTLFANLYSSSMQQQQHHHHHHQESAPPQMSATALLQKAAQMGATTSSGNSSSFAMFCNMNESKFRQAEEMTRDFLGVGSMLRMSQREQMGSSAAELGKSFAGGSLQ